MTRKNFKGKKGNVKDEEKFFEKTDEQEYGLVIKVLGGGRFTLKLNMQKKEVIGRVCGKMRKFKKQNFVDMGSVVLVNMREFQDGAVDIVYVYSHEEVRHLQKNDILVFEDSTRVNSAIQFSNEENVEFEKPKEEEFNFDEI